MSVKLAALSGVPIHITVQIAIIGVCIVMLIIGYVRKALPPFRFVTVRFYILSGLIGFLLPLTLETFCFCQNSAVCLDCGYFNDAALDFAYRSGH